MENDVVYAIVVPHLITDTALLDVLTSIDMDAVQEANQDRFVVSGSAGPPVTIVRSANYVVDCPPEIVEAWQNALDPEPIADVWLVSFGRQFPQDGNHLTAVLFERLVQDRSGGLLYNLTSRRITFRKSRPWWTSWWQAVRNTLSG